MSRPKGFKQSAETKAKLSAALKGRAPRAKGYKMSEAQKEAIANGKRGVKFSDEHRANISSSHKGHKNSPEAYAKMREKLKGRIFSEEHRANLAKVAAHSYRGGQTGDAFAAVLCPAGFIREHHIQWGDTGADRFVLDFAHLEGKVCIELDGPHHKKTIEYDAMRDALLRAMGWRTIRIRHD